jgi:50S ribosomal subunit-associated GTPase HflX
LTSPEPKSPTKESPEYTITSEKQDTNLKSLFKMMIEGFKKDINNSLREIQENTGKQLEAVKEETQKSHKELVENTIKQVKKKKQNYPGSKN